jgi:hypothetical protein
MFVITVGPSSRRRRQAEKPKGKFKRRENPLHQCQIESGVGLIVSKSMANKHPKRGTRALPSKFNKRNLSMGDHSCSDLLRNATTTPANPASATPTWAAVDRASPGSIAWIRTHLSDSNKHENEAGQLSRESVEPVASRGLVPPESTADARGSTPLRENATSKRDTSHIVFGVGTWNPRTGNCPGLQAASRAVRMAVASRLPPANGMQARISIRYHLVRRGRRGIAERSAALAPAQAKFAEGNQKDPALSVGDR